MKFLLTPELGRLAKWMRAVGYDAALSKEAIPDLLAEATEGERTIVTRLARLRGHRGTPVVWVASDQLAAQLKELKRACRLGSFQKRLFSRCILCNVSVEGIAKEKVKGRVPPYVFKMQETFFHCPSCQRIYWAATHRDRALGFLKKI